MLYLIGLGLNTDGISKYGLEVAKRCKVLYRENYTVEFPYEKKEIEHFIRKKIVDIGREKVEDLSLIDEAQKKDVGLLVYGSPLFATTHISLIQECKASGVKYKVIYAASVFDAVAETGLQLYKFGKTASMPAWDEEKNFTPDSFLDLVEANKSIDAHTLLLVDIGLGYFNAMEQLEKSVEAKGTKLGKIVVCSRMGTEKSKIAFDTISNLKRARVKEPFCFIIPGKLHFVEEEMLGTFRRVR
jgi:diphthine synthase